MKNPQLLSMSKGTIPEAFSNLESPEYWATRVYCPGGVIPNLSLAAPSAACDGEPGVSSVGSSRPAPSTLCKRGSAATAPWMSEIQSWSLLRLFRRRPK